MVLHLRGYLPLGVFLTAGITEPYNGLVGRDDLQRSAAPTVTTAPHLGLTWRRPTTLPQRGAHSDGVELPIPFLQELPVLRAPCAQCRTGTADGPGSVPVQGPGARSEREFEAKLSISAEVLHSLPWKQALLRDCLKGRQIF